MVAGGSGIDVAFGPDASARQSIVRYRRGRAAGRLFGSSLAWAGILGSAALESSYGGDADRTRHRNAVGASTAVFAALGILTGLTAATS